MASSSTPRSSTVAKAMVEPQRSGARKLLLDALSLASSRFVQVGTRGLYLIIAARMLGPESYGQLSYAQSWYMMFFQFASLGLQSIVSREVGRGGSEARNVVSGSTAAVLLASMLLSAVAATVTLYIESDPVIRLTTVVFSLAVFCRGMSTWMEMLLVAHEKGHRVLIVTMLVRPFEPVAAFLLILAGQGVVALAVLHVASWGIQAMVGLRVLLRHTDMPRPSWEPALVGGLLRASLPLMVGGAAMGFLQFGPVVVHRWLHGGHLGQLAILTQVVAMLGVVPLSVMQTLLPALSRRMVDQEEKALAIPAAIVTLCLLGSVLGATIATPFLAEPIVLLVLGVDYLPVAGVLWLTLVLVGMYGAGLAINQGLILQNRYYPLFSSTATGVMVFVVARIGLGSIYGLKNGMTSPISPQGTLTCAALGYLAWLLVGGWLSGLGLPVIRAVVIGGSALVLFQTIGGFYGIALAWMLVMIASGVVGLPRTLIYAFRAR